MVNLVEATRWAPLIGRLFIAFGNIEETTHLSIRDWAGAQIHRHFIKASLVARIDLAIDLTKTRKSELSAKEFYCESLIRARNLTQYRNLVAHNPLCLRITQDSIKSPLQEAVCHISNESKYLSFDELNEIVAAAEDCAEKMRKQFAALNT